MDFSASEQLFLKLLCAGLWEQQIDPEMFLHADWEEILTIARQQTMTGVVGDAMQSLPKDTIPKQWRMTAIRRMMEIEDANTEMNQFLPILFRRLKKQGWHVWLLKGQGVGACYPNPMRRVSGDIDVFFTSKEQYHEACKFFWANLPRNDIKAVNTKTLDFEFTVKKLYVELHGNIVTDLNRACKRHFNTWKESIVQNKELIAPQAIPGIPLPPCHFDAIFIFLHTVRHYFGGGIGLRQVADWMRYMYQYGEQLDQERLVADIRLLGLEKIWRVFGCMAVKYLGCPPEKMPLYDEKYQKEGRTVLRFILNSGNFGQFDPSIQSTSKFYIVRKLKAFSGHLQMKFRNFRMFPEESVYGIPGFIADGLKRTWSHS